MVRVLLCEDQLIVREFLLTQLEPEPGITVVGEAADGKQAVEQVDALQPDVVLMDVHMPGMDGIEATRIITSRFPKTRVIFFTGEESRQIVRDGEQAGAAAYVHKEAAIPELVRVILGVFTGKHTVQPGGAVAFLNA